MKKLVLLLLLVVPCARSEAQGVHGKILFIPDSSQPYSNEIQAALRRYYAGIVDSATSLPIDLTGYDAVFMTFVPRNYYDPDSVKIKAEQFRIVDYLRSGGKAFLASQSFLGDPGQFTKVVDTLCRFLGLMDEWYSSIVLSFNRIHGVDSEFTRGIDIPDTRPHDPLRWDESGGYHLRGPLRSVLFSTSDQSGDLAVAWISQDTSIRAVLYHAIHYQYSDLFLLRVISDYFGLCVDAVPGTSPPITNAQLSLYPNPATSSIHCVLNGVRDSPASVQVFDMLGRTVMLVSVRDASDFSLDARALVNGMYSVIVNASGRVMSGQFVVDKLNSDLQR